MRYSRFAFLILACIHLAVLGAGFLAPYDPAEQNRAAILQRPDVIRFQHALPVILTAEGRIYPLHFLVRGNKYRWFFGTVSETHLFGVDEPGHVFLAGTDEFGRDQFSRMLWGGQVSLAAGWLATLLALSFGLLSGVVAGFFGGWRDVVLMRGAELFLALPWLYFLLAVRAFLPLSLSPWKTALTIALIIGAIAWPRPARLIRGVVLSAKERDYVYSARGFGASWWHIIVKHCLPETYSVVATQATLLLPQFILAEVTLSFVGFGVGDPAVSWGTLLASFRQIAILSSAWWMLIPALLLATVVWCFSRLEDNTRSGF